MISVNNFKPGKTFIDGGEIYIVLEAKHSKQARGQASVKSKVKNLRTGSITVKTYTGGKKLEDAFIEKKPMDFLYSDQNEYYFMDNETYEQISISGKNLEWEKNFLKEGEKIQVRFFQSEVLGVEIPLKIKLKIIQASDAVKGNTQSNPQKKVVVETGFELEAPMFVKKNEIIIISTETGKYLGRSK